MEGGLQISSQLEKRVQELEKELEVLKARDSLYKNIMNSISEEMLLMDREYTIVEVNRTFLENVCLPREDVIGSKCYEVMARAGRMCDAHTEACPLREVLITKRRAELRHSQKVSGVPREYLKIAYPIGQGPEGPMFVLEISRDLEGRRALLSHLRYAEMKFLAILNSVSEAIISINQAHEIVLFNTAAEEMFGYRGHEILGQDLNILIPPQYGDHYRFVRRFMESPEPRHLNRVFRLKALRRGGKEFPVELGISSLQIESEYVFTAIIRDITQQIETEKRLLQGERFAAVGKAVAHVVHELKTPMMIIGGLSQQLLKANQDTSTQKKLEIVCEEVARLERLVTDLVDFTKEQRLVKRPFDVNHLILDVISMMRTVPTSEIYEFDLDLNEGGLLIECDPDRLKQVLINLTTNAMDAMQEGGSIWFTTKKAGDHAEITIRDSGIGIREEDLVHIFEPFYTTRRKGTGLGLSICYKIVQAHSGYIRAESCPGKGTTFVISLPLGA